MIAKPVKITANHQVKANDHENLLVFDNAKPVVVKISADDDCDFPTGERFDCWKDGVGEVRIVAAARVTLLPKASRIFGQHVGFTVLKICPNEWRIAGPVAA